MRSDAMGKGSGAIYYRGGGIKSKQEDRRKGIHWRRAMAATEDRGTKFQQPSPAKLTNIGSKKKNFFLRGRRKKRAGEWVSAGEKACVTSGFGNLTGRCES